MIGEVIIILWEKIKSENLDLKTDQNWFEFKENEFWLMANRTASAFTRLIIIFNFRFRFLSYSIYHFIAYYLEPTEPGIEDLVNIPRSE